MGLDERLHLEKDAIIGAATMGETESRLAEFGWGLLLGYFALFVICCGLLLGFDVAQVVADLEHEGLQGGYY